LQGLQIVNIVGRTKKAAELQAFSGVWDFRQFFEKGSGDSAETLTL
jgi:hypothetical protein